MFNTILIVLVTFLNFTVQSQQQMKQIEVFITQFAQPIAQWVGFNTSALQVAKQCNLYLLQQKIFAFHTQLAAIGQTFTRQHVQHIKKVFTQRVQIKNFFKCVTQKRNTQNQFFAQTKKLKYLAQFIKQYQRLSQQMFYSYERAVNKGYRLGRFFRAFFQYYYQYVLYPAETASTKLIRAMTPKTDLFNHEDISRCLSLQTSGKISQKLQNLGIYNIYIHVPETFNALKYMKFSKKCNSQKHTKMLQNIHRRLQKLDMFKIMYHEHGPWVEIAAQKFGNKQIQYIAAVFAKIANNIQHYQGLSALQQF